MIFVSMFRTLLHTRSLPYVASANLMVSRVKRLVRQLGWPGLPAVHALHLPSVPLATGKPFDLFCLLAGLKTYAGCV